MCADGNASKIVATKGIARPAADLRRLKPQSRKGVVMTTVGIISVIIVVGGGCYGLLLWFAKSTVNTHGD